MFLKFKAMIQGVKDWVLQGWKKFLTFAALMGTATLIYVNKGPDEAWVFGFRTQAGDTVEVVLDSNEIKMLFPDATEKKFMDSLITANPAEFKKLLDSAYNEARQVAYIQNGGNGDTLGIIGFRFTQNGPVIMYPILKVDTTGNSYSEAISEVEKRTRKSLEEQIWFQNVSGELIMGSGQKPSDSIIVEMAGE